MSSEPLKVTNDVCVLVNRAARFIANRQRLYIRVSGCPTWASFGSWIDPDSRRIFLCFQTRWKFHGILRVRSLDISLGLQHSVSFLDSRTVPR